MTDLQVLIGKLESNCIEYSRKDYGRYVTIDVLNKSYDFRIGGKVIGIYTKESSTSLTSVVDYQRQCKEVVAFR